MWVTTTAAYILLLVLLCFWFKIFRINIARREGTLYDALHWPRASALAFVGHLKGKLRLEVRILILSLIHISEPTRPY